MRRALGLPAGVSAVVTNGRVVELPAPAAGGTDAAAAAGDADGELHSLEPHDFELLELYAQRNQFSLQVAGLVQDAQRAGALAGADASAVAAAVSSSLAAFQPDDVSAGRHAAWAQGARRRERGVPPACHVLS